MYSKLNHIMQIENIQIYGTNLRASSSRRFASNSLLGGYLGKLEGSQASGFVVKNYKMKSITSLFCFEKEKPQNKVPIMQQFKNN